MRLKKLVPGMIIRCKTMGEKAVLYRELCRENGEEPDRAGAGSFLSEGTLNYEITDENGKAEWNLTEKEKTHLASELFLPMTADELLEFFAEHQSDNVLLEIFGFEYEFAELMKRFYPPDVVVKIQQWMLEQEGISFLKE